MNNTYLTRLYLPLVVLIVLLQSVACDHKVKQPTILPVNPDAGAREDSVKIAKALTLQAPFKNRVEADAETDTVDADPAEDAADDPAIWYNRLNPSKSLIIGTNKKAGLQVFDLNGKTLQIINAGKINNVDLRDGFPYKSQKVALVAGSNRSNNCITLFYIDPVTGLLSDSIMNIRSKVDTIYGLCMYHDQNLSGFYVFVNGKGGQIEQWELKSIASSIQPHLVRTFKVESQPEGMVADDINNILYLGVEDKGIIKTNARPDDANPYLSWINGSDTLNPAIAYDIEGLALLHKENKTYLVASIQGNFSYAIFRLGDDEGYITSFVIQDGKIDGVEETDGIEIYSGALSQQYPEGLLVVQDGFNYDAGHLKSQNFKMISLSRISGLIE